MLLEVYDKNTMDRVDIIHTFTFVQYTDYFNDVGTFSVTVPITEKSLQYLMTVGNYILFEKLGDKFIMGVIEYFHSENISKPTVEIKGYMISHILSYRCFKTTYRLRDKIFEIQRDFIQKNFINPTDVKRKISLISLSDTYDTNTETVNYCNTGNNCSESIREMNEPYHYGFALVPVIEKYNPSTGRNQNIMGMVFEQYVPVDHTVGNTDGNDPVLFDTDLNNVENIMYEIDSTKSKTIAIVAGEDKGEDRKVIEVGDTELTDINRNELYVDARDLQKEDESGSEMTDEEYEEVLTERGTEKLKENSIDYAFEATVFTQTNNSFQYGIDYKNGDYVSVINRNLGMAVKVQITGVTKSLTETGEILDLIFGNRIL